jgi:hypothetical protein
MDMTLAYKSKIPLAQLTPPLAAAQNAVHTACTAEACRRRRTIKHCRILCKTPAESQMHAK